MKRRPYLPNRKLMKRTKTGQWRVKDSKIRQTLPKDRVRSSKRD